MKHCMLLWRKPSTDMPAANADTLFHILEAFERCGPPFAMKYIKARSKKKAPLFALERHSLEEQLLSAPVNQGNRALGELGYSISLFSSMEDRASVGFSATLGNQSPRLYDTIAVDFPNGLFHSEENRQAAYRLFHVAAAAFQPYWGCMTDRSFQQSFISHGKPTSLHWVNYWSEEILDAVGRQTAAAVLRQHHLTMTHGVFEVSHATPEPGSPEHWAFTETLNKELGLH